ncbi:MAG: HEAT repeat domain-containing protein [Kofleriaceae bacterium]
MTTPSSPRRSAAGRWLARGPWLARAASWMMVALATVMLVGGTAWANVPQLIKDLEQGSDFKIRLSAAIGLTNQNDQRGVEPMIKALGDSNQNVRAAAAAGLGKLVNASTTKALQKKALAALKKAADSDSSSVVKKAATKSAADIGVIGGGGAGAIVAGGIYIDVQPVALGAGVTASGVATLMQKTITKALAKQKKMQTTVMTSWPGGKPTAADLKKNSVDGFQVTATLTSLSVKSGGGNATVACKVKLIVATYPAASMFAFVDGGASVMGADTPKEIDLSSEDCAIAVAESLIDSKVVPTLKTRTGKP